jgi:hypothetical protein
MTLFMLVDRFGNVCILMLCKNTIKEQEKTSLFEDLGALWYIKKHHILQGYCIPHFILDYIMGEYRYDVEEIYNFPIANGRAKRSSEHYVGATCEGL